MDPCIPDHRLQLQSAPVGIVTRLSNRELDPRVNSPAPTSEWIHELATAAQTDTLRVLLDEPDNLVQVGQWQFVVLQEALRRGVRVLCVYYTYDVGCI